MTDLQPYLEQQDSAVRCVFHRLESDAEVSEQQVSVPADIDGLRVDQPPVGGSLWNDCRRQGGVGSDCGGFGSEDSLDREGRR